MYHVCFINFIFNNIHNLLSGSLGEWVNGEKYTLFKLWCGVLF